MQFESCTALNIPSSKSNKLIQIITQSPHNATLPNAVRIMYFAGQQRTTHQDGCHLSEDQFAASVSFTGRGFHKRGLSMEWLANKAKAYEWVRQHSLERPVGAG